MITIYHNPRCSKSRQTLQLLEENGIQPQIVEYLQAPPTPKELNHIIKLLGITARDLVRKSEAEYKQLGLADKSISDAELVQFMAKYPKLIQRPIVINNKQAAIGRPPTAVLSIITN